jgi:hypothetical protein
VEASDNELETLEPLERLEPIKATPGSTNVTRFVKGMNNSL